MVATLLVAAHGTRSAAGAATTRSLVAAISAARPSIPVSLCFLDVAAPSLPEALDAMAGTEVVIVPLLLSAGYHVLTDIPAVVRERDAVSVARHLGPDPMVIAAVAARLRAAGGDPSSRVLLAAIASTRSAARTEVAHAAALLAGELNREVDVLPLGPDLAVPAGPLSVAVYLLAEGGFLDSLRSNIGAAGVVAEPIGAHPALVSLVWSRYAEVAGSLTAVR